MMWHLKSFFGSSLKHGVYVSCAIHFLIGFFVVICYANTAEPENEYVIFGGILQMWVVVNTSVGLLMNSPFCLWLMIAYQSLLAICSGIVVIVTLFELLLMISFVVCLCFALELYFIMITINLYEEMKYQVGQVISCPPEIRSGSNFTPQVIVQPQAFQVPVQSYPINYLQNYHVVHSTNPQITINGTRSSAAGGDMVVDHHSYLPAHTQPAFNPDFVSFCQPVNIRP